MQTTRIALAALAFLGSLSTARGQVTISWVGADGAWENPQNWLTTSTPPVNRLPINGDRIDLPAPGVTITISDAAGTIQLDATDAVQRATANNTILQTGGTINIDQFLLSSTKAAVAAGHVNYELRGGTLYSDYRSTFTWDNAGDRASRFVQTGGSAKFGATNAHGLHMAEKSSTQQAYYDLMGGTAEFGYLELGSGGADQTVVFTQTGSSTNTINGQLEIGTRAGTAGQSIYRLYGGTLTMHLAANPFVFTQPGAPCYFDFGGGTLFLRGTWSLASLAAIPNADFRVYGNPATQATLFFAAATINGQAYTRIFDCTAFATGFGRGLAGRNGIPALGASAPPRNSTTINVTAGNSSGATTAGLMLVGTGSMWVEVLGGTLHVQPLLQATLPVPAAGLTIPFSVPQNVCQTFYLQLLQLDPAAVQGVSMTPALRLTIGS